MRCPTLSHHAQLQESIRQAFDVFVQHRILVITGASGTGKSTLARRLHACAQDPEGPFIVQHASGLDENRLESQLFGHVKGAFTGAVQAFPGLAGMADSGTLCIEDIDSIERNQQPRLLRFLQEKSYRPVGDVNERRFRGRLIFTSRQGLNVLWDNGLLRQDLFYRLNSNELQLWPVKDRPRDHATVFSAIASDIQAELPSIDHRFSDQDLKDAFSMELPGNFHSLKNLILQATIKDVPMRELSPAEPVYDQSNLPERGSLKDDLDACERRLLVRALRRCSGSRDALAKELGISRRTLMYKLKAHHLSQRASYEDEERGKASPTSG